MLRRQLTTLDSFSQWDPVSGTGISGGRISGAVRADTSSWSFGAWFAAVTVDPDLGLVRVERMSGAWGAGRILNRKTLPTPDPAAAVKELERTVRRLQRWAPSGYFPHLLEQGPLR